MIRNKIIEEEKSDAIFCKGLIASTRCFMQSLSLSLSSLVILIIYDDIDIGIFLK
jgi:hypothetical protein